MAFPQHTIHPPHIWDQLRAVPNQNKLETAYGQWQQQDDGKRMFISHVYGHLTRTGAWDLQVLGCQLRQRYVNELKFLPVPANVSDAPSVPLSSLIYARATNFARTIQSMQNLLIGLLTPDAQTNFLKVSENCEEQIGSQSGPKLLPNMWGDQGILPIHIRDEMEETLWCNSKACPALRYYGKERKLGNRETESIEGAPGPLPFDAKEFNQNLRKVTGLQLNEDIDYLMYHDIWRCRSRHHLPLPEEITPTLFDQLVKYTTWIMHHKFTDRDFISLGMGRLVGEILDEMQWRIQRPATPAAAAKDHSISKPLPKFLLFAGHDTTLMPLLCALKAFNGVWPRYNSLLLIELWKEKSSSAHWVRLIYNGTPLQFGGAGIKRVGEFVSWDEFHKMAWAIVPQDFERQCSL